MATVAAPPRHDDLLANPPRGLVYGAFCIVIVLQLLYIFTFNWHPDLRLPFSTALAAIHVAMAALTLTVRPANWHLLLLACIGVTVLTLIPPHAMGYAEVRGFDGAELIRRLILPIMMIWILSFPLALPVRLLWCAAVFGPLYGVYIVTVEPPLFYNPNDSGPRFASITGHINQIHPSAKFVALQLVLIDLLRRGGFMKPFLAWGLIGVCGYLLLGYGARTQFMFVALYFGTILFFRYQRSIVVRWLPFLGLVLVVTAASIALLLGTDTHKWGSGRVGTWAYRLQFIADRDLVNLLFGGGIGADQMWTPVWGWAPDAEFTSHNDYLFFLTDHGFLGLLLPFMLLAALWLRTQELGRAVVVAVAITAILDNGYFRTPMLSAFLTIVLATSILVSLHLEARKQAVSRIAAGQREQA